MKAHVEAFAARHWDVPLRALDVRLESVQGGLESAVAVATVTAARHERAPASERFVVKELQPAHGREADIYEQLWRAPQPPPLPRVLGVQTVGNTRYLYLEEVRRISPWPWADTTLAALVCAALGRFHDRADLSAPAVAEWDYEADLAVSAASTLQAAYDSRDHEGARNWRRPGDVKRVVGALTRIRSRLLARDRTLIHGDVHPGNVLLRDGPPADRVVLLDWTRARVGSPLEDIASWLHSLGCWEPQARCRHDTLLRAYLAARRQPRPVTAELRRDYWFACASNGLSGAIRYHLAVVGDRASSGAARYDSWRALRAWERVVRRAASLVTTNPAC